MPKKRLVQTTLKFFTYTKHRPVNEEKLEQERKKAKEEHLKRIRELLNTKPKQLLKKKEKKEIVDAVAREPPWGNMPEMYPGQYQGKPFLPSSIPEQKTETENKSTGQNELGSLD